MATTIEVGSLEELRAFVLTCPIVDNHAHNILRSDALRLADFLTLTSEATGHALEDTPKSLSHLRALKQLRKLYGLQGGADWTAILAKRSEALQTDSDGLVRRCLEGTQTILVDDGLNGDFHPYQWHNRYTLSPCKRIVRIEAVASTLLSSLYQQAKLPTGAAIADDEACRLAWVTFIAAFERAIASYITDTEVAGFKSVVCYRTGLNVKTGRDVDISEAGMRSFRRHFLPEAVSRDFRVEAKGMNDALVMSTCKLIAAAYRQNGVAKPIQFHTGLGDNDINLLDSNPAYLQPLIEAFPAVPIVLLHSSYPYTREAGYLATVYKNVYLDIGEVFMLVSRDGLDHIFRQALELTPTSKILYSTDGHHFPETYWLSNINGRETISKIMCEYVEREDLTVQQGIEAVKDILFENSNKLYNLHLTMAPRWNMPAVSEFDSRIGASTSTTAVAPEIDQTAAVVSSPYDLNRFASFMQDESDTKFVFVQWLDFLAQLRSRCLPIAEFQKLVRCGDRISISTGNLGTLQNDQMSSVCNPVGAICIEPDIVSLRPMQSLGPIKNTATVMARMTDENGAGLDLCPRSALQKVVEAFGKEYQLNFLVGFEIEITFCNRNPSGSEEAFQPLDTCHSWGTFTDEQYTTSIHLIMEMTTALQDIGIEVQQMHSEAGAGQYEFVLPPLPPAEAVDTLIQAKQCIAQIAATHKLRATCHPQPFPGIGTAAHAHISFNSSSVPSEELERLEMSFMACILKHLRALCALTMPQATSYDRVVGDSWTGGIWVAWGTQNREVPLRRVLSGRRWEVRCLDGMANMYLALHAVFAVGMMGLKDGVVMQMKDCPKNPTTLSIPEREELGITKKLPKSISTSLKSLENDVKLQEAASPGIILHFLAMKKAEQEMLNAMSESEQRVWLMERY